MKICPFTLEEYEGEMVEGDCDVCGELTTYEEDAYGCDYIVLCGGSHCATDSK